MAFHGQSNTFCATLPRAWGGLRPPQDALPEEREDWDEQRGVEPENSNLSSPLTPLRLRESSSKAQCEVNKKLIFFCALN